MQEYIVDFPISFDKYKSLIKIVKGNPTNEELIDHGYYWQWMSDRYFRGLNNTIEQYRGFDKYLTKI